MAIELKGSLVNASSEEAAYARTNEKIDTEIGNLNDRIDNIIVDGSSTEGNTELIDIRTGADGIVYETAGKAVRNQVQQIYIFDDDNQKTYKAKIQVVNGKPILSYDEV